jgi:hypothetical protein
MFQILNKLTPKTSAIVTNEHLSITLTYEPLNVHYKHPSTPKPCTPTLRVANMTNIFQGANVELIHFPATMKEKITY